MSDKAWIYLFYLSLALIPTLSIFGRTLQFLLSDNNLIGIADYLIGSGLLATSLLVVASALRGPIDWALIFVSIIIFVLTPYQLERYEERLHFICFGVLGFTAYRSFGFRAAVILTCSVGLVDEVLQYHLPYRVGHWRDVIINCFAGLSAVSLAHGAGK